MTDGALYARPTSRWSAINTEMRVSVRPVNGCISFHGGVVAVGTIERWWYPESWRVPGDGAHLTPERSTSEVPQG